MAVLDIFRQLCDAPGHQFWSEDISILQIIESETIITNVQITDVYLLGLAVHKRGKLATLDQHIPAETVRGGRKALELVVP